MPFQFAIFYLFNKTLKVENTSLILEKLELVQLKDIADLHGDGDDNFKIKVLLWR